MNKAGTQADRELLYKGVFITLIGVSVLLAPSFMSASGLRDVVASSSLVGWFALVLGAAFLVQYGLRRRATGQPSPPDKT